MVCGLLESFWQNKRYSCVQPLTHFEIIVVSDTGKYGIRTVIFHKFEDGRKRVVHASRTLLAAEKKITAR